ncbi:putative bifunctional diguanylate cyclase/phosphodiesterase [Cupriavidus sp. USMAHM13]|uniref:putative bifunctional diguanylate cyclase/phosphodiesterase n=1 Tax=Cupriavidus sp. USMAHM13 TaxID=1389192 RepID=UPI0009F38899|nr:EAL domain-containing protein [Cupriavidus sp. USMAHM13]
MLPGALSQDSYDLATELPSIFGAEESRLVGEEPRRFEGALSTFAVSALLEASAGLAVQVNEQGHIVAASLKSADVLEYSRDSLLQCRLADLVTGQDQDHFLRAFHLAWEHGSASTQPLQFSKGLTGSAWLELRLVVLNTEGAASLVVYGQDVTAWKQNTDELSREILRDPLTGLGNRLMVREELQLAIERTQSQNTHIAVAILDLDGFKKINDSLGHDIGDELLRQISKRLKAAVREHDIVSRVGGDEFVIVLPNLSTEKEARSVATRILTTIQQPIPLAGHQLQMSTSIGLALYPQHGSSEADLMKNADAAMYRAKEQGKNAYCVYNSEIGIQKEHALAMELSMFQAIRNGEFDLHYQPICRAMTREVIAVESLMRWTHDEQDVPPAEFIRLAEENGLIHLLGGWALRTAAMQLSQWDSVGLRLDYLTVNVSPVQFLHPGFPATVYKAVQDSGIEPHRLVLEITEGALIRDPKKTEAVFEELKAFGVKFAIDDFGTGYSNLRNLKRFPLTSLKVDRSFVSEVCESSNDQAIVSLILLLAKELGLTIVAEGVETEAQLSFLVERGCTYIQGWLVSRALPPQALEERIHSGKLKLGS